MLADPPLNHTQLYFVSSLGLIISDDNVYFSAQLHQLVSNINIVFSSHTCCRVRCFFVMILAFPSFITSTKEVKFHPEFALLFQN